MRHIKLIICISLITLCACLNVKALSCPNSVAKDLNSIATHVKVSYEVIDKSVTKEITYNNSSKTLTIPNYSFEIAIYNITSDIYLTIQDDVSSEDRTIYYTDTTNGNYTFTNNDFGRIYKYTISIKSANDNCYGQKIKNITLIKPKFNAYSQYSYCESSSNYYCQKFTTNELNIKDDDDFFNKIKVNNDSNKPPITTTRKSTVTNMIKDNQILYICIFAGVIIVTTLIIIIINKKKNNKNKGWNL